MLIGNYLPINVMGLYMHIDSIFRMGPYGLFQVYGYLCTWAFPLFIGKYLRHGLPYTLVLHHITQHFYFSQAVTAPELAHKDHFLPIYYV
jgi:hypothetical protein